MSFTWPLGARRARCRADPPGAAVGPAPPAAQGGRARLERGGDPRRHPARAHWKRRIPLGLLVASLVLLAIGAARPTANRTISRSSTSILLAIDVSRSMCSTDVAPNRLVVAQDAARTFVRSQRDGTQIGLVAFAGFAGLVVPQTTDQHTLLDAIDKLTTSRGTAIGMAILASIDAIAEKNSAVAPTGVELGSDQPATTAPTAGGSAPGTSAPAAPTGDFQPDVIVVLTDGANTQGVEPLVAAQAGRRPSRAGVHDRVRHDHARRTRVQHRPARRRRAGRRAVRQRPARRLAPVAGASSRSTRRPCRASPT